MPEFARVAATATLTAALGVGLAGPALAQPSTDPTFCAVVGGTAYPPGSCTFTANPTFQFGGFTIAVNAQLIVSGDRLQLTLKYGAYQAVLVVMPGGLRLTVTTDGNGVADVAVPTTDVPIGAQQLTVAAASTPATAVSVPVTVVSPDDVVGVAAARKLAGVAAASPALSAVNVSTMAVDPKAQFISVDPATLPVGDRTGSYALIGGIALGGIALSGAHSPRRRQNH